MVLYQCSTLRTGTSPPRHRDTVLAGLGTAEDAKRNLEALGLVNLPSTFFSLHTLFIPLVPGLAVDFFFFPFLSAALAQLKVAASALPGVEMAWDGLGTQCHSSAPSHQQYLLRLIALSRAKLSGETPSLCHTAAFVCYLGRE